MLLLLNPSYFFLYLYNFPPKQSTPQKQQENTQTHQHFQIVLSSIVEFERNFDLLSVNFSWSWVGERERSNVLNFVSSPLCVCVCVTCFFFLNQFVLNNY